MSVIHLKKKDIVKSKVRGVEIEFDHEKLATILGIPGNNGICEYVKDVWEESKYIKPLEITRSGENRRSDDINVPAEEEAEKEEENQTGFDWEAVIDEAATEGESGSGEKFYDAENEAQGSPAMHDEIPAAESHGSTRRDGAGLLRVDPRAPVAKFGKLNLRNSSEFERKRANRFHDDLEKAKAENARLLALLHQAQTKPHP
ncbi:hypothetical protein Dimus_008384 [Dionaea muscipula]